MKFSQFGAGFVHTSKKGTKAIRLSLDKDAQKQIMSHDWEKSIYIFKTKNTDKNGNPIYTINTSMPDDYAYKRNEN